MRLRRSDFLLWDYPKRQSWARIKKQLRRQEWNEESDSDVLAWALKRASARGAYVIGERATFLAWLVALGTLLTEADMARGHQARQALRLVWATTSEQKKVWLEEIGVTEPLPLETAS